MVARIDGLADCSHWPDREDSSFAPAEHREKVEHLYPREILLVEQPHSAGRLFTRDDRHTRFHPFAKHSAAHVAWGDFHSGIVADAFHFSRDADRVHVQLRVVRIETRRRIRRKPYRRLHTLAA